MAISRQREPFVELLTAYGMAHARMYLRMCQPKAFGLPQPLYIKVDKSLQRRAVDVAILVFHTAQLTQLFWRRDGDETILVSCIEREGLAVSLAINIGHIDTHFIGKTGFSR